jgi:hypothetical protein
MSLETMTVINDKDNDNKNWNNDNNVHRNND